MKAPLAQPSQPPSNLVARLSEAQRQDLGTQAPRQLRGLSVEPGQLVELQTLDGSGASYHAFATSADEVVELASSLVATDKFGRTNPIPYSGIFVVGNEHVPAYEAAHVAGRWLPNDGKTKNETIARRRLVPIDFDTVRPSGISASKSELDNTLQVAFRAMRDLETVLPSASLLPLMSGNGVQLHVLCDLPNTPEVDLLAYRFLVVLDQLFSTGRVKVDTSVHDAKRLIPLAGTWKRKGADHRHEDPTRDRRHRRVWCAPPDAPQVLSSDELEALVETLTVRLTAEQREAVDQALAKKAGRAPTTAAAPSMRAVRTGPHPFEVAGDLATSDVMSALGLMEGAKGKCPVCGATEGTHTNAHTFKCHHATCNAYSAGNLGLVARTVFGQDDVSSKSPIGKANARQAYGWLRERFPQLPELGTARIAKLSLVDATSAIRAAAPEAVQYNYTDTGNAERFAALHGADVRWATDSKTFYVWTGTHWHRDDRDLLVRAKMKDVARAIATDAANLPPEQAAPIVAFALRSEGRKALVDAIEMLKSEPGIAIKSSDFDQDGSILNLANGTLDLVTFELRAPRREDMCSHRLSTAYRPDASAPTWRAFVGSTSTDPAVIAFRHRRAGQCLTGEADQFLHIQFGTPGSGKSTFNEAIANVLEGFGGKVPKSIFEARREDPHPADVMTLRGKRFAFGSEIKSKLNVDRLKELTGDERLTARGMGEDWTDFRRQFKLTFYSNDRPEIARGSTDGIWRRVIFDPWTIRIATPRDTEEIKDAYRAEAEGILAWLVEGLREFRRVGLAPPASILAETQSLQDESDTFSPFVGDVLEVGDEHEATFEGLWAARQSWLASREIKIRETKTAFGTALSARYKKGKNGKGNTVYFGVRLRPLGPTDDEIEEAMTALVAPTEPAPEPPKGEPRTLTLESVKRSGDSVHVSARTQLGSSIGGSFALDPEQVEVLRRHIGDEIWATVEGGYLTRFEIIQGGSVS